MEILEAVGTNGQIKVEGNLIHITRKGFTAFTQHGLDGTKTIFLSKLSGVQFMEASKLGTGYIQFIFSGSRENKNGFFSAIKDENTVMFNLKQNDDFIKIRDYIFSKVQG